MDPNLVPISQIVKATQTDKIHLAYLTKLRLLPQTIRRKIDDRIEGCYPDYVIPLLAKIEGLKNAGLTYSQIKFQLREEPAAAISNFQFPISNYNYSLTFLIIGLLLGYLLATNKPASNDVVAAPISPLDETSKTMLKVVSGKTETQNLYRLGMTDMNDLIR